jgi:LCP family protein required for cell wall assembly
MSDKRDFQSTSLGHTTKQRLRLKQGAALLVLLLFLMAIAGSAAGYHNSPVIAHTPAAIATELGPTSSSTPTTIVATATPDASPTLAALPTVPAVARTTKTRSKATALTPQPTVTSTPSPSATLLPSPTPTNTNTPTPEAEPSPVATTAFSEEILHILLIGGDTDYVLDMNTDTLIVAIVAPKTRQVSLLSIPRDLWVYIPTYGWGRINMAHRIGQRFKYPEGRGPGLLMRTIEENLGIPIDHWVRIGYDGFARAIDELGGVDMVVPCAVNLRYQPSASEEQPELILQPGVHHLDGATALRYVRTRRGDSDFEREHRQQQFLRAVWRQFKRPEIVLKIPGLWSALKGAFATDLKLGDVLGLAPVALELQPQRIRSYYIGRGQVENWTTPEGWSVLLPIPEKVQQLVASLYLPPAADQDAETSKPAQIQIRNGTPRAGLSLIAADQLGWEGFNVVDTGPADRADYKRSQIVVFKDKPDALRVIVGLLGVRPERVIQRPDPSQSADMEVILGADYDPCK